MKTPMRVQLEKKQPPQKPPKKRISKNDRRPRAFVLSKLTDNQRCVSEARRTDIQAKQAIKQSIKQATKRPTKQAIELSSYRVIEIIEQTAKQETAPTVLTFSLNCNCNVFHFLLKSSFFYYI